jgi:hypothetical protein
MNKKEIIEAFKILSITDQHEVGEDIRKELSKYDGKLSTTKAKGLLGENFLKDITGNDIKYEVKTEVGTYLQTKKAYVEIQQYSDITRHLELSGINVTEADFWVTVLVKDGKPHCAIINNVSWFKENERELYRYLASKGKTKEGSASNGFAIPFDILLGIKEIGK